MTIDVDNENTAMEKKMRNEQGSVNAENIQGTYDHEHELNKKIESHTTLSKEDQEKKAQARRVKTAKEEKDTVPGVHAENTGGTAKEGPNRNLKS
ncbi:hypothetical protein [Desertivirga arenae]|uniref:hypothetical protein n=1 Tax=Desertivirga arenae TaxID=2810309 RepID=UPI001A97AC98|nr:hypothetical protein [Pedobacter sp. SYSU D00823]